MSALLTQTGMILKNSAELLNSPIVVPAVKGLFGFLKKVFTNNKRAKQRLEMIEKMEANEETINSLKTNLEDAMYENDELKKELEKIVKDVDDKMQKAGMGNISKTNEQNISGNNNIGFQDISGGKINIDK